MDNNYTEIQQRLLRFMESQGWITAKAKILATDSLLDSGILDSLAILGLVEYLRSEFGIRVADADLIPDNFETLIDLERMIRKKSDDWVA